ncbi:hypothetical protein [Nonomuraea sp. NPDC049129]|uniref:hypothetical protein n=1 Tax=Nonomuraea sp. NPDC049129 TaxID=3155272 RepID=UPI0033FBA99E
MTTTAVRVPYVVAYEVETVALNLATIHDVWALSGRRLSYTDPVASDWVMGVLWARQKCDRRGKVSYKEMHTLRQRKCMLHRLCQVCEGPALNPGTGRISWVFHEEQPAASGRVSKPPTCLRCIPEALASCPHLQQDARVYSSGGYEPWGVKGIVLSPGSQPTRQDVQLNDPFTLEYTLARALIVHVRDLRPERAP